MWIRYVLPKFSFWNLGASNTQWSTVTAVCFSSSHTPHTLCKQRDKQQYPPTLEAWRQWFCSHQQLHAQLSQDTRRTGRNYSAKESHQLWTASEWQWCWCMRFLLADQSCRKLWLLILSNNNFVWPFKPSVILGFKFQLPHRMGDFWTTIKCCHLVQCTEVGTEGLKWSGNCVCHLL